MTNLEAQNVSQSLVKHSLCHQEIENESKLYI
jgi:hypothetical protein